MMLNKRKTGLKETKGAFTLIELLVVIAIIGLLASMLLPSLARAKESAKGIQCINQLKQLGLAFHMYCQDNNDFVTPRDINKRWPQYLLPYFGNDKSVNTNMALLRCPVDGPLDPMTIGTNTNYAADCAPRSYIINGWNDWAHDAMGDAFASIYTSYGTNISMKVNYVKWQSDVILFGEKKSPNDLNTLDEDKNLAFCGQFYMDFDGGTFGDDAEVIQSKRHKTGSNYGMFDGSARFIKNGMATSPINLWAVTADTRTKNAFITQ